MDTCWAASAWHTLVFYLPVAFGALLAIGAAFGMMGDGHGDRRRRRGNVDGDGATRTATTSLLSLLAWAGAAGGASHAAVVQASAAWG